MAKPIDPQASIQWIWDNAPKLAKAKGERVYVEEFRKSLKALLMGASKETTAVAREQAAYADEDYIAHLAVIRTAIEAEETLRWRMVSAEAAVEVWRSQEASNRRLDRATA